MVVKRSAMFYFGECNKFLPFQIFSKIFLLPSSVWNIQVAKLRIYTRNKDLYFYWFEHLHRISLTRYEFSAYIYKFKGMNKWWKIHRISEIYPSKKIVLCFFDTSSFIVATFRLSIKGKMPIISRVYRI